MKKDALDLTAELEGISAMLYSISDPLVQGDSRMSYEAIGVALHAIASHVDRIAADVGDLDEVGAKK